MHDLK